MECHIFTILTWLISEIPFDWWPLQHGELFCQRCWLSSGGPKLWYIIMKMITKYSVIQNILKEKEKRYVAVKVFCVELINFKVYLTYTCKARNIGYADNIDRTLRTQLNKQEPKAFVANWHRTSAFDCNTGFSFD